MPIKVPASERRSADELYQHYQVEKALAAKIRQSARHERAQMYQDVYNELFTRIPSHPQMWKRRDQAVTQLLVQEKRALLSGLIRPTTTYLEVGAGDCSLALEIAQTARQVYALEVSEEVTRGVVGPSNFSIILSSGTEVPVPAQSITVAFSYQVMEHIHPEDVEEQLRNIYEALAPGGLYVCVTPNRLSGPHDISKYFDEAATGLHMQEYSQTDVAQLFRRIGFRRVRVRAGAKGRFSTIPIEAVAICERVLEHLPHRARRTIIDMPGVRNVLYAAIIGEKGRV